MLWGTISTSVRSLFCLLSCYTNVALLSCLHSSSLYVLTLVDPVIYIYIYIYYIYMYIYIYIYVYILLPLTPDYQLLKYYFCCYFLLATIWFSFLYYICYTWTCRYVYIYYLFYNCNKHGWVASFLYISLFI